MATIDLLSDGSLPANTLKESTNPRGSNPNGNIYFDLTTGEIQIITADELATIDFGAGAVPNPLANLGASGGGITARALYGFERERRKVNETLRYAKPFLSASYKYAGAYEMVNGRRIAAADVKKVRGSGMVWRAASGVVSRIYFGARTLNPVAETSQVYRQLAQFGEPSNFSYTGPVDEMFQVYGSTSAGDAGAGDFDTRSYLALSVRTFGKTHDRKVLADSGVGVMDGFSTGFALGEADHNTTGAYTLSDVYNADPALQVGVWQNMTLEMLAVPQTVTGFVEGDGAFTWRLNNPGGANLDQCVAYLDAVAAVDADIDAGAGVLKGKRVNTWYSYDQQGRVLTRSGAGDSKGLLIEGMIGTDKQRIVQTADDGPRTYPFYPTIVIPVGQYASADPNAWYHVFFKDGPGTADFGTDEAITVLNTAGAPVKGLVDGDTQVVFEFNYDADTLGGPAGTDKDIVILVEGNGKATAALTEATISRQAVITAPCQPGLETGL